MTPDTSRQITQVFTSADRDNLLVSPDAITARKTARVVALRIPSPFLVDTDHGQMLANAGDYLVTNHPDDDPSSDVWPISAERFNRSYREVEAVTYCTVCPHAMHLHTEDGHCGGGCH